uniref:Phytanoyl-CoA hydroxylase-interacting protein-like C-terminal domain-containing protein n=1 Tax=Meloidogyne floridensis TaxID=298350 RepID=A0A915P496_9BILA
MEKHNFLVRMHNLPRNSSLCQILHFIWETVDFQPDEALVRAYSANDAIIGFVNKKFADETVRYCNGRGWYGRIISVSPSNDEELQQIIEESKIAGPDKGPERLGRRKNIEDEIYNDENRNDFDEDNSDFVFGGLDNYSDSDSDDLNLMVPDYFLHGAAPDTLNFNSAQNPERLPKNKNAGQKSLTMKQSSFDSSRESQRTINNSDKSQPTKLGKRARRRPGKAQRRKSANESSSQQPSALSHQKLTGKRLRLESSSQQPSPLNSANSSFQKVPNSVRIQSASSDQALNRFPIPSIHTIPVRQSPPIPFNRGAKWGPPPISFPQLSSSSASTSISSFSVRDTTPFEIQIIISSQHCLLKWSIPDDIYINSQSVEITGGSDEKIVQRLAREKQYLQKVTPGTRYSATIQGFDVEGRQCAISSVHYRAYFSKSELERVMALASRFCGDLMYQFDIVHRCKPKSYFDNIYSQPGGQRMMMPYLKDENGHPGCPINGEIEGCFFSSLLQGDSLPNASPFGDVQMILEVNKILDFKRMNMYFADFYCNQAFAGGQGVSSALHYITVVVCEKNSQTDKFCASRLLRLDPSNNKFLKLLPTSNSGSPRYLTNSTSGLLVEIYYTKPVSLFQAKKFREISTIGKGSSRPMGLPNNKLCKICN